MAQLISSVFSERTFPATTPSPDAPDVHPACAAACACRLVAPSDPAQPPPSLPLLPAACLPVLQAHGISQDAHLLLTATHQALACLRLWPVQRQQNLLHPLSFPALYGLPCCRRCASCSALPCWAPAPLIYGVASTPPQFSSASFPSGVHPSHAPAPDSPACISGPCSLPCTHTPLI